MYLEGQLMSMTRSLTSFAQDHKMGVLSKRRGWRFSFGRLEPTAPGTWEHNLCTQDMPGHAECGILFKFRILQSCLNFHTSIYLYYRFLSLQTLATWPNHTRADLPLLTHMYPEAVKMHIRTAHFLSELQEQTMLSCNIRFSSSNQAH